LPGELWVAGIFTLLTPILATSFRPFCAIRLLTGMGLGVLLPLATTYSPKPSLKAPLKDGAWLAHMGDVAALVAAFAICKDSCADRLREARRMHEISTKEEVCLDYRLA
jgi:hypothetical protein